MLPPPSVPLAVESPQIKVPILFTGLVSLLLLSAVWTLDVRNLLSFVPDDTAYFLEIAHNFSAGSGSTFDGINPTNGYQPLWQWVLVPVFALAHFSPELMLRLVLGLQILMLFVATGLTLDIWRRAFCAATITAMLIPFLFFVFIQAVEGMEGALLLLCVSLLLHTTLRTRFWVARSIGPALLVGFLLGLVMLARLDTVFMALGLGLVLLGRWFRVPEGRALVLRNLVLVVMASSVVVAPYLIHNELVYGEAVPISGILKNTFPEVDANPSLAKVPRRALVFAFLTALAVLAGVRMRPSRPQAGPIYLALVAGCVGIFLHLTDTVFYVTWAIFPWHFQLYRYFGVLALGFLLDPILTRLKGRGILGALVLVVAMLGAMAGQRTWAKYHMPLANWHTATYEAALWARSQTPSETIFAMKDSGNFGYFSQRRTINLDGLVNDLEFQEALKGGDILGYLEGKGARYLVRQAFPETETSLDGRDYPAFEMAIFSHLYRVHSWKILLPGSAEVFRSKPYPFRGGETRLRVFDLEKVFNAPGTAAAGTES